MCKRSIERANQVWCTDITYLPVLKGHFYLVAVMDWYSRKVLAWAISNTMEVSFCIQALQRALARYGSPQIFNSDQGAQFTATAFTDCLKAADIAISMDGRGRYLDNIFIERLWRSIKYELSTWTELFGLGFGGNTSNKGPQYLKLQLHAEFNCVHLPGESEVLPKSGA